MKRRKGEKQIFHLLFDIPKCPEGQDLFWLKLGGQDLIQVPHMVGRAQVHCFPGCVLISKKTGSEAELELEPTQPNMVCRQLEHYTNCASLVFSS